MSLEEHLRHVARQFHLCTHLPLRSFRYDGELLCSVGYQHDWEERLGLIGLFESARSALANQTATPVIIPAGEQLAFAATVICRQNQDRGFHLIGPYAPLPQQVYPEILHKPAACIPHLITLLQHIAADSRYMQQKTKRSHSAPYSLYVKRTLDSLDARYMEDISAAAVAAQLHISTSYLCNLLKKETGRTFSQWLNAVRIEKSKELLRQPNGSLLDVALAVGFNNQNYYNIMFKKLAQQTPREYRQQAL